MDEQYRPNAVAQDGLAVDIGRSLIKRRSPEVRVPMASSHEHTMTSTLTEHGWFSTLRQFLRFGLVGGLNTIVDLLILNVLLWLFPIQHTSLLIIYNSIAYGIGAINSFVLNKYWTFGHRKHTTPAELLRFVVTTCA